MSLGEKHLEVAKILVKEIKYGENIFYDDLRRRVGLAKEEMPILWGLIGDLSVFCFKNDMPLISAMVINIEDNRPGDGFYFADGLYEDSRGVKVNSEDDKLMAYLSEWNLIKQYKDWSKLIDLLEEEIGTKNSMEKIREGVVRLNKTKNRKSRILTEVLEIEESFKEGKIKLETHEKRERNPKLINVAKKQFKKTNGKLYCEICNFDFEEVYGELGIDFIEGHHTKPVSQMEEETDSKIEDIQMLCANCHRMVHRAIERGKDIEEIENRFIEV